VLFEIETLDASPWHRFWSALDAPEPDIRGGWSAFQQRFATATCPLPAGLAAAARRRLYRDVSAAAARCGVSVVPVRDDPAPPVAMAPWAISEQPGNRRRPEVPAGPGGPLAGLRVVEAGRRVQGPLAGHLLGALGAEVVRVEPPGGDPSRGVPPMAGGCSARFFALNRGKRVVEADLRSPGGRREVRELVAEADVFLHNWAPGRAAQIGLDATDLAAVRPDLVYACASGWSGALDPDPPIGTDFLVQAYSGVAAAAAPPGGRATPSLMTLTDVLGGLVCAEGVLAALVARARTGRGQRVDSSLLSAALVLLDTAGERAGPAAGGTWVREPLRTADGYLALAGDTDVEPGKLAAAFGAGVADDVPAQCRREPTATWLARLAGYGIAAAAVATDLGTLAEDSRFAAALDWDGCAVPAPPWRFTP
jgi:crotonobetainyl-CoA:carnitine CoA-transferase CaiB-like acyl-CoA transferase